MFYSFERAQYLEMIQLWEAPTGDMAGKNANQTYGAEHLCRLLGTHSPLHPSHLQTDY
jgi:hypothetical protein